jgi:hypothetical protein
VIIGLIWGVGGILVLASQRTNSRPITPALPTPVISVQRPATPTPLPEIPTVNLADLQQELTSLILNYERTRDNHDQVIKDLSDVGLRAANTSVSEAAAQQIARVRQDRDRALEAELTRMRNETIRLLYKQGPEAARAFLNQYKGPFEADLQTLFVNLRRRIQAWERQERSQQEANLVLAQKGLDDLYKRLAPLMVKREWPQALSMVKEAAEEPTLFPVSSEVAALREELLALQAVPDLILKSYANQLNQEVILKLYDRDLPVKIREVKSDGLLVGRTVYAEDGSSVGSAELFIAFSMLSSMEVQNQLELMEGPEIMIYRALIANRNGEREVSRALLEELGSPLALALRNELFSLPTLGNPFLEVQEPDRDLPFNKPRFVPLPNLELP